VTRPTGVAKLIMLTTLAMTRGGISPAADWSETLDAGANAAYDTNPELVPGSRAADRSAQLTVDGNTQMATEVSQLTVTPHLSIIRYDREKNLDVTSGSLVLAFQDKGERSQWSFSGDAVTDSTLTSELGQTGINNINLRHDGYNASIGYQYFSTERLSWLLQGTGQITHYNDEAQRFGLTSYNYGSIQFGPTWAFSDRLGGSLSIETDRLDPRSGSPQRDDSVYLQLKRHFSEKYSWRISGGATRVDVPGSPGTSTSATYELGATRQGERVQWDLSAKRAVLPIGLGLLARENVGAVTATVVLTERSSLNLSANVIRTDPVSIFLFFAPGISLRYQLYSGAAWGQTTAEWQYHFSPHWAVSAAAMCARARNYNVTEWANGNQARLGILWQSGRL